MPNGFTTPDPSNAFMTEAVNRHIQESVKPLEEQVAMQSKMIVEREQKIAALETQLAESENWRKKFEELVAGVGDLNEAATIKKKYEAARTRVIPELLEQNDVLQGELAAVKELVEAHTGEAENNRVSAYIESAISNARPQLRPRLRAMLEGSRDVIEVDERLTNLEALMGRTLSEMPVLLGPATGGTGTPSTAGPEPATPDWMPGAEEGDEGEGDLTQTAMPTPAPNMNTISAGGTYGDVGMGQPAPGNKPMPPAPGVRSESRRRRPQGRYIPESTRRAARRRMSVQENIDRNRLPQPRSGNGRQVVMESAPMMEQTNNNCKREVKNLAESLGG